jgi:hypothetical protein
VNLEALLARLRARGVRIERRADQVVVRPASVVSAEEMQELRRRKPEVLRMLTSQPDQHLGAEAVPQSYAHPWPDTLPSLGPRTIGAIEPCCSCGVGTWVRYGVKAFCARCARAASQRPTGVRETSGS